MQESYDSAEPSANAPLLPRETSKAVEMVESISLLSRAHRAAGSNTSVRTYKLCALPDDVPTGHRKERSSKNKPSKMENFASEIDRVSVANVIQLFGRTSNQTEFHRLDIDAAKFETHTSGRLGFGSPLQRGIFSQRDTTWRRRRLLVLRQTPWSSTRTSGSPRGSKCRGSPEVPTALRRQRLRDH